MTQDNASLLDRDPTPEDVEAERDPPRPGVWAGVTVADLRALTQDETDCLIRAELYFTRSTGTTWEREMRAAVGGEPRAVDFTDRDGRVTRTYRQRGGIDSDPLIRVLARRAWGERDRQWFELRGVRKGDRVRVLEVLDAGGPNSEWPAEAIVARAWPSEAFYAVATEDARPGTLVRVRRDGLRRIAQFDRRPIRAHAIARCRVGERLREPPPER